MSITQEQIKKIAEKPSKIPWDNEKLIWNIKDILKYIDLLEEINTTWVKPTVSVANHKTTFRRDKEIKKEVLAKDLLECSEQKVVANQIIIPNIIKK